MYVDYQEIFIPLHCLELRHLEFMLQSDKLKNMAVYNNYNLGGVKLSFWFSATMM